QFRKAVILQSGRMGVVPKIVIIPGPGREAQPAIPDVLPKLMGVKVPIVRCGEDLALRYATQALDHEPIGLVIAEPPDMSLQGVDASIRDLDTPRRELTNRPTSPRRVEVTARHWIPHIGPSAGIESPTGFGCTANSILSAGV